MRKKNLLLLFLLSLLGATAIQAQPEPGTNPDNPALQVSGFVDAYFAYDFNRPPDHERPGFLFNHNRHNEFNINMALLRAHYETEQVRGTVGLMAGTYAQYNLADEHPLLQHVFEAHAGVRLARGLWLDMGVLPSHIGFESAISLNNHTLTRSIMAENSPYYLSGAQLSYEPNERWSLAGLVINGWQNIRETPGNSNKAIGTRVTYTPHERVTLNWSTFTGQEQPDWAPRWRYFHNFFGEFRLNPRLKMVTALDVGWQQQSPGSRRYDRWFTPVLALQYFVSEKVELNTRAEHYADPGGVIIIAPSPAGFRTSGFSLGFGYHPTPNMAVRVEGRAFRASDRIFERGADLTHWNPFTVASLAIAFN
jgi:hypothetical protein